MSNDELAIKDDGQPMTAAGIRAQVNLVQEVMKAVMQDTVHYGKIPGCGDKPTLLKPGAEKLMQTFRLAVDPQVLEIPTEDGVTFRVFARITSQVSGIFLGTGLGEASTKEEKYNWRKATCDAEYENTPEDRRRVKYAASYQVKQVRMNPADIANTVLKMAKKRALVDGILTVTAASDCFTQDIEDMPPEVLGRAAEPTKTKSADTVKSAGKGAPAEKGKPAEKTPPAGTEGVVVVVQDVTTKSGEKNGKRWQAWTIHAGGIKYGTFSETLASVAVPGSTVKIFFTVGKFGNEAVAVEPVEVAPGDVSVDPECPKSAQKCEHSAFQTGGSAHCRKDDNACPYMV